MKKIVFVLVFAIIMLSIVGGISKLAFSGEKEDPLAGKTAFSPGVLVLAERNGMAKAGMRGSALSFDRSDFFRALNVSRVSEITFTSVPSAAEGKLLVGNTVLSSGQTVSGSNLSLISFRAASPDITRTTFRFSPDGEAYEIECTLYFLDEINYAPTVSIAPAVSLEVSTYENVTHYGKLSAYDPDGDECVFEIVSATKNGIVIISDNTNGEYLYVPRNGYVGKDKFSYIARDKYGNYSASAEVSISVSRAAIASSFSDMQDSDALSAAIKLTEKGIMSGTQMGDGYYFQPDKAVSRSEFVVLAMQTLGIKEVNSLRVTDFADDADIPASMKGYVAAAYELEYITGSFVDGKRCFLPNKSITRAEAAVIVGRMLEVATPTVTPDISDREDIPAWAESSVYSLCSLGVLDTEGGEVRAKDVMNRADTAKLLSAMMSIAE